jgi:Leucine-rich repeat (LRR) protein
VLARIEVLNFDSNELGDWRHTNGALEPCTSFVPVFGVFNLLMRYRSLQQLILSSNGIGEIPPLGSYPSPLRGLRVLSLSSNKLHNLGDIDRLYEWCPQLESLRLTNNPLTEG